MALQLLHANKIYCTETLCTHHKSNLTQVTNSELSKGKHANDVTVEKRKNLKMVRLTWLTREIKACNTEEAKQYNKPDVS
jgi:hypothetical protein